MFLKYNTLQKKYLLLNPKFLIKSLFNITEIKRLV